tara:strand:+ start:123 stop:902 length:780 start_codon:yes stop_codon:yes gene_type:complete
MARFFYFIINTIVFAVFAAILFMIFFSHVIEVTQIYGTNLYEIIPGGFVVENSSLFYVGSTFIAFLLMIYSIKSKNYLDKMVVFSKKGLLSVVLLFLLLFTYSISMHQNIEYEFIPEVIASAKKNGSLIFPYDINETKESFDRRINLSTDIKNLEEMLENNKTIKVASACYHWPESFKKFIEINADNIETVKGNFRGSLGCFSGSSSSSSSSSLSPGAARCLRVAKADLDACVASRPESRWNSCKRDYEDMLAGCSATE